MEVLLLGQLYKLPGRHHKTLLLGQLEVLLLGRLYKLPGQKILSHSLISLPQQDFNKIY
jgi:hypothetical protein